MSETNVNMMNLDLTELQQSADETKQMLIVINNLVWYLAGVATTTVIGGVAYIANDCKNRRKKVVKVDNNSVSLLNDINGKLDDIAIAIRIEDDNNSKDSIA